MTITWALASAPVPVPEILLLFLMQLIMRLVLFKVEATRVLVEYAHLAIKSWNATEDASIWEEKIALELSLQKAKDVLK